MFSNGKNTSAIRANPGPTQLGVETGHAAVDAPVLIPVGTLSSTRMLVVLHVNISHYL